MTPEELRARTSASALGVIEHPAGRQRWEVVIHTLARSGN